MEDNNLQLLDQALDEASYYWLETNYPEIMAGIEEGLKNGAGPTDIRRRVLQRTGREEMARRCEQAARHVAQTIQSSLHEKLRMEWFGATPVKTGIQPEQVETGLEALEKKEMT